MASSDVFVHIRGEDHSGASVYVLFEGSVPPPGETAVLTDENWGRIQLVHGPLEAGSRLSMYFLPHQPIVVEDLWAELALPLGSFGSASWYGFLGESSCRVLDRIQAAPRPEDWTAIFDRRGLRNWSDYPLVDYEDHPGEFHSHVLIEGIDDHGRSYLVGSLDEVLGFSVFVRTNTGIICQKICEGISLDPSFPTIDTKGEGTIAPTLRRAIWDHDRGYRLFDLFLSGQDQARSQWAQLYRENLPLEPLGPANDGLRSLDGLPPSGPLMRPQGRGSGSYQLWNPWSHGEQGPIIARSGREQLRVSSAAIAPPPQPHHDQELLVVQGPGFAYLRPSKDMGLALSSWVELLKIIEAARDQGWKRETMVAVASPVAFAPLFQWQLAGFRVEEGSRAPKGYRTPLWFRESPWSRGRMAVHPLVEALGAGAILPL